MWPDLGARAAGRGVAGPLARRRGWGSSDQKGEELDLARPTMGEACRGWDAHAADLASAFATEAALLAGVVRRPRARRLHLLLLASGREEEAELRGA